jgi:pyruvate,orthophosphate dikinase
MTPPTTPVTAAGWIYGTCAARWTPAGEVEIAGGSHGRVASTMLVDRGVAGRRGTWESLPAAVRDSLLQIAGELLDPLTRGLVLEYVAPVPRPGSGAAARLLSVHPLPGTGADRVEHLLRQLDLGLVSVDEVIATLDAGCLPHLPAAGAEAWPAPIATGLPASPGLGTGRLVIDPGLVGATEAAVLAVGQFEPEHTPLLRRLAGLIVLNGGTTSHGCVVARAAGVPCVAGLPDAAIDAGRLRLGDRRLDPGAPVAIDGTRGAIHAGEQRTGANDRCDLLAGIGRRAAALSALAVEVSGEEPDLLRAALDSGAAGVGLCRTEQLLAGDGRLEPSLLADPPALRAHLVEAYGRILDAAAPARVVVRLLDVNESGHGPDARGCRIGLLDPELYEAQVDALLAAMRMGGGGAVSVLLPFVTFPAEVARLRELVAERAEAAGLHPDRLPVGAMIETPSALLLAAAVAREAAFLVVGLNDLTELIHGLSRTAGEREVVASWLRMGAIEANPFTVVASPLLDAVIAGISQATAAAPDVPVSVCGDRLHDPELLTLLRRSGASAVVTSAPLVVPTAIAAAQSRS